MIALVFAMTLQSLVDKVIAAYGPWQNVTAIRATGRVLPAMRSDEGKLTREWQAPDKLRVEIVYPSHTEVRVVDGNHGAQNGKEASGMGLDAMRLQAARIALPLLLAKNRASLRTAGENAVEIPLPDKMSVTVDVDPATGHILKSTGKADGIEFSTTYSDFRSVDGLLFAFRETNTAMGNTTATNELSNVAVSRAK